MGPSDRGVGAGGPHPGVGTRPPGLPETGRREFASGCWSDGGRVAREHALSPGPCNIRGCGARTSHLTFPKS
jgi:hypothetical protein